MKKGEILRVKVHKVVTIYTIFLFYMLNNSGLEKNIQNIANTGKDKLLNITFLGSNCHSF